MGSAPLRRVLHASTALIPLLIPLASWDLVRIGLAAGIPLVLALEWLRLSVPAVAHRVAALVPVFRPAEASAVSGATWLWLGFAATAWFPPSAAAAGMVVAALADPAASLVGARWGRGAPKSGAGTVAAVAMALATLGLMGTAWPAAMSGAAAAGALERWSGRIDDNLVLAPGVALVVAMLT